MEKYTNLLEGTKFEKIELLVSAHLTNGKNPALAFHADIVKAKRDHNLELASKRVQYEKIILDAEYKRETPEEEKKYMKEKLRGLMGLENLTTQKDTSDKADGSHSKCEYISSFVNNPLLMEV